MLLKDLDINLSSALIALCHNISATYLAYNPVLHSRSKHIAIDYHFVREKVLLGDLVVKNVPTQFQLADMFTKALSSSKFLVAVSNLCLMRVATKRLLQLRHLIYQLNHLAIFLDYSQMAPSK
ncbi:hypothetical protein LIER_08019 [Lithospermum erythrorhizon]|uniref:Retrovirus-related Pol polyprotein from transposon TNT 1-94 n=1 Tax=Lithospermum erythrorhizon TaxID=34254 RepID=A0AAV3PAF5_LITER